MITHEVYLINLDRSRDRLARIDHDLKRLNIEYSRISAIDAKTLTTSVYERVTTPNFEYPHLLKAGEVACFLSHRNCWQRLVNSNKNWALILEDNCEFNSHSAEYMSSPEWIPHDCELIQLTFSGQPTFAKQQILLPQANTLLAMTHTSPSGSSAYFISRRAALVALQQSQKINSPVDNFLFSSLSEYTKQIQPWRLFKAVAKRADVTTTISGRGTKNKLINKERFHPKRIAKKLCIKIQRIILKKKQQIWEI